MSRPATPVLMSADNPKGWKLEDLLIQLREEIAAKNARIAGDQSATAILVRANNTRILDHFYVAEDLQRDSVARLDALRPDPGPGGTPRIGAGAIAPES